jgi:hypothetical protein
MSTVRNIPQMTCDTLNVNLILAGSQAGMSGSAKRFGAFQAAVDTTQDRTLNDLDPRECEGKTHKLASGKFGIDIVWENPDCAPADDDFCDFDCTLGQLSAPTTTKTTFEIGECAGMNLNIPNKDWFDSCCGLEEYYTKVLEARAMGRTGRDIQNLIQDMTQSSAFETRYSSLLVAEKIKTTLAKPVTGTLAKINSYVLGKLSAGAGYNHVLDTVTGLPVGNATWNLPVLFTQNIGNCPSPIKRIDPNTLRTEINKFLRLHPRCGNRFAIVGGSRFIEMFDQLDVACCSSDGINQANAIRGVMGFMANFYVDDSLLPDVFYIIEENSLAFFWLTGTRKPLADVNGMGGITRYSGKISVPISNCRDNGMNFLFDTRLHANVTCETDPNFNIQMLADYGLWTRPAIGCDNPQTGIYKCLLTDIC